MKKLMIFAICAMAVMVSCKQQGQTASADATDSVSAVIDSIIEEAQADTVPMPMFIIGSDGKYMQMLYWIDIKEPQKEKDMTDDELGAWHQSWALQEMFRRNAAQYTNLFVDGKIVKVKFVDEVLKDPDGNTPSMGQIHSVYGIPSLAARFEFADAKQKVEDRWGDVLVTDGYLASRQCLDVKPTSARYDKRPKMPADIVKQLEQRYGMKASRSAATFNIGTRYLWGIVQFEGVYKNAPKDKYDPDRQHALALEVLVDQQPVGGDAPKVYTIEKLGYYDSQWGPTWNVDDEGEYISNNIEAAFEGPKGLEICWTRGAPESFAVGMDYLRDGSLVDCQYEIFQSMIDEEKPIWKSDIAEMQKLYEASGDGTLGGLNFTKYGHFYVDYDNEWIWLRDASEQYGAYFLRTDDGKFHYLTAEDAKLKPARLQKGDTYYFRVSGSAGGPSTYAEYFGFKNGKQVEHFTMLAVYGEIQESTYNGKPLGKEAAQAWLDRFTDINALPVETWFKDTEAKN